MVDNSNKLKKKSNIYLTPENFLKEYNLSVDEKKPTDRLIIMFKNIATEFSKVWIHTNKCDRDACINYGVSEAWRKWDKFDPKVSNNLFSFFTTMISNDMRLHYKKLTKSKDVNISINALFSNNNN